MRAGTLRNCGSVQVRTGSRDDHGSQSPIWKTVIPTIHFSLEATGSEEKEVAGAVRAMSKFTVGCRYFSKIQAGMRLVFGKRIFSINSVNDQTGFKRELVLGVVEGVSSN